MTPEQQQQFQVMLEHLKNYKTIICPICDGREWEFNGLQAPPGFDPSGALVLGKSMPLAVLMCRRCYFVRHFAWVAVERAVKFKIAAKEVAEATIPPTGFSRDSGGGKNG